MECKRCGNKDSAFFYRGSKGFYCRKCVGFKRILLLEEPKTKEYEISESVDEYKFTYELSKHQKEASNKVLNGLLDNKDILLKCVCGSGKTEIVVDSISYYLNKGLKVCYAISRKEVVIELTSRFKNIFKKAKVVSVYGGHHNEIFGDLIICTTHQLYRYYNTFDLLIIDECDAFPLSGNETLMNISLRACKGNVIFSTATTNAFLEKILKKRKYTEVNLYVRPSYKPIIVPKVIYTMKILNIILLIILLKKEKNQCIVFISSKRKCISYYKILKNLFSITYAYSDLDSRNQNILDFRNNKYKHILSTTVLERGITVKNVDVIVIFDRYLAFDKSSLIQMTGRVGRSINNPFGKAYIVANCFDKGIKDSIKEIKKANDVLKMSNV